MQAYSRWCRFAHHSSMCARSLTICLHAGPRVQHVVMTSRVSVSYSDDCRHGEITELTDKHGYLALVPRSISVSGWDDLVTAGTCDWTITTEQGRSIVLSWARQTPISTGEFTNRQSVVVITVGREPRRIE